MSAYAKVVSFWRSTTQGIRHAPFIHCIAVGTLAVALFTAGLARGTTRLLDSLLASLGGEVEVTVYLPEDAELTQAQALARELERRTGGTARVVSKAEALGRLTRELGSLGNVLNDLRENPLPLSVELGMPPGQRTPAGLRTLAAELRALPTVAGVDYGEQAVERISAIAAAVRYGGLVASLVVALVTVVVISATLQLAIYARREEIEIQKLVGATDLFVKVPFLLEGLFQGLMGAGLAALGLLGFSSLAAPRLAQLFSFMLGRGGAPPLLTPGVLLELAVAGGVLGLVGSFIAVGRFLRV